MKNGKDSKDRIDKGWYVLRAISGKEAKVKELLDGVIKNTPLGDYVFQVLIPTEKVLTVRGGKKVVKERNLYSGYVFVEAILTGEVISVLTNTTNVIDFLRGRGKDAKPERLRESEVMRMLGTADDLQEPGDDEINDYMVGETVKVNEGPFNGFAGVIEDVLRDKRSSKWLLKSLAVNSARARQLASGTGIINC